MITKILITGALGQLGRALNRLILENNNLEVINTDVNESYDTTIGKVYGLDITDLEKVECMLTEIQPDVIINCAAHTAVDVCETDKENAYNINVLGPKNLAQIADKINSKLVQISTDYVFDGVSTIPYTEEMKANPLSVYAFTKYQAEKEVMHNCSRFYIIRTAWMYGEGKNFVGTMLKLAAINNEIKVVDDQVGTPTSAIEVARFIMYIIETNDYGLYHATCEGSATWYQFAKKIFEFANINITVKPIKSSEYPTLAERPAYSVLENKRIKHETNFVFANWEIELKNYVEKLNKSQ